MDGIQFDALTRTLTAPTDRRDTVRAIAGGTFAAIAAVVSDAVAKKKKTCKGNKKKCGQKCIPKDACCSDRDCPQDWDCVKHMCRVLAGTCQPDDGTCPIQNVDCGIGGGCDCFPTAQGVRCGARIDDSECGDCNDAADCRANGYGADTFCVNGAACCPTPGVGFCARACTICVGNNDCPKGCLCGDRPESETGRCVEKEGPCGASCAEDGDCAATHRCVAVPGCTGFRCRRRCGA